MKTFDLNGKQIIAKEMDFNTVCDIEDMGVSLEDYQNKFFSFLRGYVASCAGISIEEAGKEIEGHIVSKKKLDAITSIIQEEIENSDFFRALNQEEEPETPTETEPETEEKVTKSKKATKSE